MKSRSNNPPGQPMPEYTLDHKRVLKLMAEGKTTNQIIHQTGLPKTTINRWIRWAQCRSELSMAAGCTGAKCAVRRTRRGDLQTFGHVGRTRLKSRRWRRR